MVLPRICVVATLLLLPGCALFGSDESKNASLSAAIPWGQLFTGDRSDVNSLPAPLPWSRRKADAQDDTSTILLMARLEANIATRPANDPCIRSLVWEELDESGLMSPENRQRLNLSGFRVGVAGSATPWALQSLAREATVAGRSTDAQQSIPEMSHSGMMALGPVFSVMQNGKSLLEVQSQLDPQTIPLSRIPDLASLRDRSGLRCVFEVSVKELNDDWALLSVLPQIHAGAATTRLSINGTSNQLPVRQNIVPLYDQQFTVKLHTGEVAVIGRHDSGDWNPGRLFFQPDSGTSASERLLMIRLAGVDKVRGQSDASFRVGAYNK